MMSNLDEILSRRAALARMGGVAILAVFPGDWIEKGKRDPFPHPDPRPGITAANVLPVEKLPDKKRVRAAFAAAREYPELFDGVYCVCECTSQGHRSLLTCFESEQPTGCWGCQELAEFVVERARKGQKLAEIRTAIDKKFGESAHKH
jgi:hypothetical protein